MDALWLDVQNVHATCGCHAARLFHDEGHGVALVQQPQLQPFRNNHMSHQHQTTNYVLPFELHHTVNIICKYMTVFLDTDWAIALHWFIGDHYIAMLIAID